MQEFTLNKFLTLKLEEGKTVIYVNKKPFTQCKYLLLVIPLEYTDDLEDINSIDEAAEKLSHLLEEDDDFESEIKIDPETEFWAHCSNLQAWVENNYDSRLLHYNLAFPLLEALSKAGDLNALKAFKEEIALRLESGYPSVIIFLIAEKFIDYLEREDFLLCILNEKDAFNALKIESILNVKLSPEYESFDLGDENLFMFENRKVLGLSLSNSNINSVFKYITKLENLFALDLAECNLTKLPKSIEKLKKSLEILDLSSNKLESIPIVIKKLTNLQNLYLRANNISDINNVVEITEKLERLNHLDLSYNKIKILPEDIEQIKKIGIIELMHNLIEHIPDSVKDKWQFRF